MIPAFDNFTVAHHKNRFGILNGREPVSNYKTGAAFHQSLHRALDQGLRTGIDRAGRLVENQDIWIGQKRPRDSQELALPLRNVGGILPKLETVSSGLGITSGSSPCRFPAGMICPYTGKRMSAD